MLGALPAQIARAGRRLATARYMVELYSGPFRSMSHALQRCYGGSNVATVTVDYNPRFRPDVCADLQGWNLWAWLLRQDFFWTAAGTLNLPAHLHFSPSCTTFGCAAGVHGRSDDHPGGYADDWEAASA